MSDQTETVKLYRPSFPGVAEVVRRADSLDGLLPVLRRRGEYELAIQREPGAGEADSAYPKIVQKIVTEWPELQDALNDLDRYSPEGAG